jgi:hypothetical protein
MASLRIKHHAQTTVLKHPGPDYFHHYATDQYILGEWVHVNKTDVHNLKKTCAKGWACFSETCPLNHFATLHQANFVATPDGKYLKVHFPEDEPYKVHCRYCNELMSPLQDPEHVCQEDDTAKSDQITSDRIQSDQITSMEYQYMKAAEEAFKQCEVAEKKANEAQDAAYAAQDVADGLLKLQKDLEKKANFAAWQLKQFHDLINTKFE